MGPFLDFRGKQMPKEALDCPEGTLHIKLSKTLCVKMAEKLDVVIEQQLKLDSVRKKLNLLRDIVAGKQEEPPRAGLLTERECVAQILQLLVLALPADEKYPIDNLLTARYQLLQVCRVCKCTDSQACMTDNGPCHWVEPDLCSACVGKEKG